MDPNLKLVLEEIQKTKDEFGRRFDEHNEQWERRFADLDLTRAARDAAVDKRLDTIELASADTAYTIGRRVAYLEAYRVDPHHDERDDRITALEVAATDLGTWRPEVEALVDDLRIEVKKLSQARDPKVLDVSPQWPNIVASSSSAPSGHGDASSYQDGGLGTGMVWTHVPVVGKQSEPFPPPPPPPPPNPRSTPTLPYRPPPPPNPSPHPPPLPSPNLPRHQSPHPQPRPPPLHIPPRPPIFTPRHQTPHEPIDSQHPNLTGRLPKLPFNKFDGENPRLWCSSCE